MATQATAAQIRERSLPREAEGRMYAIAFDMDIESLRIEELDDLMPAVQQAAGE
jgi:hypothetical protein